MRRSIAAAALALLGSSLATADEGELGLAATVGVEGTTLRHPQGLYDLATFSLSPTLVAGVGVEHGVSNVLDAGLGVEAAFSGNLTSPGASLGGARGDIVTGLVLDTRLPLGLVAHLDAGLPVTAGLALEAGPSLILWSSSALVDPFRKDPSGRPARLPITVDDQLALGAFLRLRVPIEFRLFETLALAIEPSLSVAWVGGPAGTVGAALRTIWLPGVGPL